MKPTLLNRTVLFCEFQPVSPAAEQQRICHIKTNPGSAPQTVKYVEAVVAL